MHPSAEGIINFDCTDLIYWVLHSQVMKLVCLMQIELLHEPEMVLILDGQSAWPYQSFFLSILTHFLYELIKIMRWIICLWCENGQFDSFLIAYNSVCFATGPKANQNTLFTWCSDLFFSFFFFKILFQSLSTLKTNKTKKKKKK